MGGWLSFLNVFLSPLLVAFPICNLSELQLKNVRNNASTLFAYFLEFINSGNIIVTKTFINKSFCRFSNWFFLSLPFLPFYREVVISLLSVLNEIAGCGVQPRAVSEAFHPMDLNNSEIKRELVLMEFPLTRSTG